MTQSRTSHLRIVCDDLMGHHAQVFYVDGDGHETEISDVIQAVDLRVKMGVGDLNVATLTAIKVEGDVRAFSKDVANAIAREMAKIGPREVLA